MGTTPTSMQPLSTTINLSRGSTKLSRLPQLHLLQNPLLGSGCRSTIFTKLTVVNGWSRSRASNPCNFWPMRMRRLVSEGACTVRGLLRKMPKHQRVSDRTVVITRHARLDSPATSNNISSLVKAGVEVLIAQTRNRSLLSGLRAGH